MLILEGKFGPGTKAAVKLSDPNWKAEVGAIENKNRPEALYITFSTWFKPRMSVLKAKQIATDDPEELAVEIAKSFKKDIDRASKRIASFFDSRYFNTSSIIFTYDFAEQQAKPNKSQFLELEINIDTVNDIDSNGEPVPSRETGKIEHIPFKDFEKSVQKALNQLLAMDLFSRNSTVEFSKKKGG